MRPRPAAAAAIIVSIDWLRRLPSRAPLIRIVLWVLLDGAVIAAVVAVVSPRQLPSGRWQGRYPGPDGTLRPAPDTFERKGDASNWLADKRTEINRDEWIDPDAGKVTFGTYATIWIKEHDLAETTAERYDGILRNHIEPHLGERALSEIKEPVVRQWRHSSVRAALIYQHASRSRDKQIGPKYSGGFRRTYPS